MSKDTGGTMSATIERTLALLEILVAGPGATPKQMADATGLPVSTIYRYLAVFVERGFARKNEDSATYTAGARVLALSQTTHASNEFGAFMKDLLVEIEAKTGETVFLCAPSGAHSVAVAVVDSQKPMKLAMQRGDALPLYASGPSKTLLAFMPPSSIQRYLKTVDLKRLASGTITSVEKLCQEIECIRANGYATSNSEVDEAISSVAFPILDENQIAKFALAIAGPEPRFSTERLPEIIATLKEYSAIMTEKYRDYVQVAPEAAWGDGK